MATAAIDTVALSAICTRTVWSVKAYKNNYYSHNIRFYYVYYTRVCLRYITMYIIFFISFAVASRIECVPAVGFCTAIGIL